MEIVAILFDLGDVIMQEESEIKDIEENTLRADLVDGIGTVLHELKLRGYKLGLVADTRPKTAWNVLYQHGLYDLFDALAISEELGTEKPDPRMFLAALEALRVPPEDYARVVMVGNNPARDIRGANRVGLISVWFHWNDRYVPDPEQVDKADYTIHTARALLELIEKLDP